MWNKKCREIIVLDYGDEKNSPYDEDKLPKSKNGNSKTYLLYQSFFVSQFPSVCPIYFSY
jgi:hypothetical protein